VTVSRDNSKAVYQGLESAGIRFLSALPETWLVHLLHLAEDDLALPENAFRFRRAVSVTT